MEQGDILWENCEAQLIIYHNGSFFIQLDHCISIFFDQKGPFEKEKVKSY